MVLINLSAVTDYYIKWFQDLLKNLSKTDALKFRLNMIKKIESFSLKKFMEEKYELKKINIWQQVTSSDPRITSSNPRAGRLKARVARLGVRAGRIMPRA